MKRAALISWMGWMAAAGCTPSAPINLGGNDSGATVDAAADGATGDAPAVVDGGMKTGDVPAVTDVPAATDVPKGDDVPPGEDVPVVGDDVPVVTDDVPVVTDDVPAAMDVPATDDVPVVTDVPAAMDVPVVTDAPPAMDVPAATDVPVAVDVAPVDPCAAPVNLNLAGTLAGATLRYTGNNTGTAAATSYGTCARPGHVLAFAYTPRTSTRLRISTDNAGTPETFDTVLFAQDRCVATGAMSLGCHDDVGAGTRVRASTITTPAVTAGTTVFVFVAGYEPSTGAPYTSVGPFELSITELPIIAAGGTCDLTGATNVCAAGASCRSVASAGVCLADGVLGAGCRAAAPRCDTGLACGAGEVCEITPGTNGGACRATGTACDAGLACASATSRCRPAVAEGAACDVTGVANACPATVQCVGGTCRRSWVESALASPTFQDACAVGTHLMLSGTSRDDTRTAEAVALPFAFSFFGEAQTQFWVSTNGFIQFGAAAPAVPSPTGGNLPSATMGPMIAAYWEDLVLRAAPASDLCVATAGAAPNRRMIVAWQDTYRYSVNESHLSVEAILYEGSNVIDLIYGRLEAPAGSANYVDGSRATIGLQNAMGARFITHTGTVSTTAGIRFAPVP